jgi:RNA polymerase sigma-70 factor (ECF subfamily)
VFGSLLWQIVDVDRLTHLLLEAQQGDHRAFEQFVIESQADVWRLCRYLGDLRDADDLAQETYERAIGSLHRYRREGPAKAWLLTIARRVCVDHTRRQQRRRRREARAIDDALTGGGIGSVIAPDDAGRLSLEALVDSLDDDRRAAFVLTQVLGLQYAEAAEVLGCPIGTVRSRVARARLDLVAAATANEDFSDDLPPTGTNDGFRTT